MSEGDGGFAVVGVATRTTNAAESDPATAQLPGLWARAFGNAYLHGEVEQGAALVAVLTDYESDASGAYTQVVGVQVTSAATHPPPEGLVAVAVPSEERAHVEAYGSMPEALVTAWRSVWEQTASGALRRAYRTDYEVHTEGGADLYVSVERP